ncbi:MAG TPA: 1,4-dihydroxy-2-naphthoate polyprenyltransferase [Clostridia bacterium]|nr:1,4-dihydroxy-2-naphthoate polyprenyltransferase [Clostridia bacterium]
MWSLLRQNPWILASRPKTLPAASAPVIVGTALALGDGTFRFGPALAALICALLIQIGTNFANDVFDYQKGTDTQERTGPLRVTQAGLLTPRQVFRGMCLVFGLAFLIGLYLIAVGGWPILVIGLLSILSGIAYTGGPYPLGYHGLGDLFVFIFFGPVAVCGTYYVQALSLTGQAFAASVPMGLLITAILVVNNYRDLPTDCKAGKRTLAVRLGPAGTRWEYVALLGLSYLVPLSLWLLGPGTPWLLLPLLTVPLAARLIKDMYTREGAALNETLAGTGKLVLLYGLCYGVGYVLGSMRVELACL